jgi:hypothetical protein
VVIANSARKKEEPNKEAESSIEESEDVEWASEVCVCACVCVYMYMYVCTLNPKPYVYMYV